MSWALDERLSSLKAYVPGEQPKPGQYIKLNTNEFPYAPAQNVAEAAAEAVINMNLYSDLNCTSLREEFKRVFSYGDKNVIFTNGSDEGLYLSFLAFCGKNSGVAFADITYGFYSVYADLCGIEKEIIPLADDFRIIPEDYYNLNKTIFIANPNAPTGLKLTHDQLDEILSKNESIVVVDEAYVDFSADGSCAKLLKKHKNLVVIGTFSKSRGMAGARLGYVISNEEIIEDLEKVKYSINPYNVNSLTQAVGTAVLKNNDYYLECISKICKTRVDFSNQLVDLGFSVIPSETNFVFAKHPDYSGELISEELRKNGVLIRHFGNERIKDYVRITIGTEEQMNTVIEILKEIVGGQK